MDICGLGEGGVEVRCTEDSNKGLVSCYQKMFILLGNSVKTKFLFSMMA
jgi:hypothetical protein